MSPQRKAATCRFYVGLAFSPTAMRVRTCDLVARPSRRDERVASDVPEMLLHAPFRLRSREFFCPRFFCLSFYFLNGYQAGDRDLAAGKAIYRTSGVTPPARQIASSAIQASSSLMTWPCTSVK